VTRAPRRQKKTPVPSAPPVVVDAAKAATCTEDPTGPGRTFLPTPGAKSFLVLVSVAARVLFGSAQGLPPNYSWTLSATSDGCSWCCARSVISIFARGRIARRCAGDPCATLPAAAIFCPRWRGRRSGSGSRMAGCSPPAACRSRVGARDARASSAARRSRGTPWSGRWKGPAPSRRSLTRIVTRSGGRSPVAATVQNLRGSPCPSRVAVRVIRADSSARGRETRRACSMRIARPRCRPPRTSHAARSAGVPSRPGCDARAIGCARISRAPTVPGLGTIGLSRSATSR
jgi:hypothetical protein